jgi:hypothetical protein
MWCSVHGVIGGEPTGIRYPQQVFALLLHARGSANDVGPMTLLSLKTLAIAGRWCYELQPQAASDRP